MKALLICPEFPDTFFGFRHAIKFIGKKGLLPPLGLLTVAAILPKEWNKRLIDLNVRELGEEDLAWADLVFISGIVVQREAARRTVFRCKQAGVKVVAGGPLFTIEHEQFADVDHFVLNEAERTLPPFLEDLENGCAKHVYKTTELCDVRKTPIPLWELADLKQYARMGIQFSRGCPFDCEVCDVTALFGKGPRIKTAEQILFELDSLYSLGWRGRLLFVDDNLIGNKKYLKTHLLPALIQWRKDKRGMPINAQASVNLADDEALMEMMFDAGFDSVFVGIETPDEKTLAECNKKQNTNRDLLESVKRIQRAGLQVIGGFIVGFDSDRPSIFQRQAEFIQESGIVTAMTGLLQAPVGTKLYKRLEREGRLCGLSSGDNVDGTTNVIPKMGLEPLLNGYRDLMHRIYSPKPYYERIKTFLRDYRDPNVGVPLDLQIFLAFFRAGLRLGVLGKGRLHYWRLLAWTVFHRPRLLSLAITFAINGYHLRRICDLRIF